jgi:hypothetical protein
MPVRELKLSLDTSALRDALGLTEESFPTTQLTSRSARSWLPRRPARPAQERRNPATR